MTFFRSAVCPDLADFSHSRSFKSDTFYEIYSEPIQHYSLRPLRHSQGGIELVQITSAAFRQNDPFSSTVAGATWRFRTGITPRNTRVLTGLTFAANFAARLNEDRLIVSQKPSIDPPPDSASPI